MLWFVADGPTAASGTLDDTVVPSPSCPLPPAPQQYIFPSRVTASENSWPADILVAPLIPGTSEGMWSLSEAIPRSPRPSWPLSPQPQEYTCPDSVRPMEWYPPQLTSTTALRSISSRGWGTVIVSRCPVCARCALPHVHTRHLAHTDPHQASLQRPTSLLLAVLLPRAA